MPSRDTAAESPPAAHSRRSLYGPPYHVGCHASRSLRPRIFPNRRCVKWLPASWSLKDRACRTRRAPVLKSRCWAARQGPALDGDGQGEPAQEIVIRPEAVAGEARPAGGGFPFLDPLLDRPAPVVEADDGPVRPGQRGDDEAHPRDQLAEVMLDFGNDPPRPVPRCGLVVEAAVADQRGVTLKPPPTGLFSYRRFLSR